MLQVCYVCYDENTYIHVFHNGITRPGLARGGIFVLGVRVRGVRTGYKNLYPYLRIILLNFHGAGLPPANS